MKLQRPTALPIDHWTKPDVGYATMRVTSPFGWRGAAFHGGLDIGNARLGDDVVAAAAGRVLAVGNLGKPWSEPTTRWPSGNWGGLMIVLSHGDDVFTVYAHLQRALVAQGAAVSAGQHIGDVGESGSAAPPPQGGGGHLHFTVQAPPAMIPAGLAHRASDYGLGGHDVDPWPLITGATELGAARFTDVPPSHRFAEEIEWLAANRITYGLPDGTFRPDGMVTRGQLAAMLYRMHHRLKE